MKKQTIIYDLIKIKDLYFVWDNNKSRPLTHGMKKYELEDWVAVNEGEFGLELLEKRIKSLEDIGLSIPNNEIVSLSMFIANNKASPERKTLNENDIYNLYTYEYIDEIKTKDEKVKNTSEKELKRLPEEISMSSKFYFFFVIITLCLIGLYYLPEIKYIHDMIMEYKVNMEKFNLIIFTLLGLLLGIIISPKLYLWNYNKKL